MQDLREPIRQVLADSLEKPSREAAIALLSTLGYSSSRTLDLGGSSPTLFREFIREHASLETFNEEKALYTNWSSADLLFQITDEELSGRRSLFEETGVRPGLLRSYLFFALELEGGDYPRGKLTSIARQINRVFPMPVMVIFRHRSDNRPVLSIAVINRRQNKRDANKDVLGKVAIIRDISLINPHRGHLDILASLAFANLEHPQRLPINNFDALHAAWEEIFNVELLNARFYRELSNWYFWALPQVRFPADTPAAQEDDEKHRATALIRLLTRIIFCWFIKEKDLVPEALFNEADLKGVLDDLDPDVSTYYQALLQNLFFATLNTQMGKGRNGESHRAFARDEGFQKNRTTHGVSTLFRYEEHFSDPDAALDLFGDVPFLNGGLFESLDRDDPDSASGKRLYVDGFTRNPAKRPHVPNKLFFAGRHRADLSEASGLESLRNAEVRGLLPILHGYKFTIVENTPIDQEVALDPELLGKVFENLLASYNEETKSTARKQTGSFYTPRTIVEYMVDEALKAHLANALVAAGMTETEAADGLNTLFAYTEKDHPFLEAEVGALLDAIHASKILDPACGSGAFPMGVLQKLVYIIHKLDPDNEKWKRLQIERASEIPDASARQAAITAIERDFEENEDDYGRKLYLIENCLYGVDIQPIAIQISKLRFFISLVADQRTNRDKSKNRGVRPLPNLETKFVAADTLAGLPEAEYQPALVDPRVDVIERDLERAYHDHFTARTRSEKRRIQGKVRELREELARLLAEGLGSQKKAEHVAEWDPFDPQASADFFDPHWMFGRSLAEGFDIIIGNPPYLKERDSKHVFDRVTRTAWGVSYHKGKMDYWFFFLHRALEMAKHGGIVGYITSRYWMNSTGSTNLVRHIRESASLYHVVDIGNLKVFDQVAGHHMLHFYKVGLQQSPCSVKQLEGTLEDIALSVSTDSLKITLQQPERLFTDNNELRLYQSSVTVASEIKLGDRFEVSQGVVQNPDKVSTTMSKRYGLPRGDGVFVLDTEEYAMLRLNKKEMSFVKPFYDESAVLPYRLDRLSAKHLLYLTKKTCPNLEGMENIEQHLMRYRDIMDARRETIKGTIAWFHLHWPRDPRFFELEKVVLPSMFRSPSASFIPEPAYFGLGSNVVIGGCSRFTLRTLCALLNSSVAAWWFVTNSKHRGSGVDVGVTRLRQFPLPTNLEPFSTIERLVTMVLPSLGGGKTLEAQFLIDLLDACVMECYFREHMAERDLLFHEALAESLSKYDPGAPEAEQDEVLHYLYGTLNAPDAVVRNRLLRISADSPELLAVIKEEGRV